MKAGTRILNRIRSRSPRPRAGEPGSAEAPAADEHQLPISGYDGLDDKQIVDQLRELSQVELAEVEQHERSHRERPAVLSKLRYMRSSEPLEGYDALDADEVSHALTGADAERVKAVRDYERKFQNRHGVLDEVARVLPDSPASAGETRAREEKDARVRASTRREPGQRPA